MKKRLLPIALMAVLVLGGCAQNDNTGGGDGGGEQIVAPVLSKVEITNRADLQAEWHLNDLAKPTKSVQIACTPENNPDLLIHQGSMTVTSSDTNVITVKGRKLTPKAVGKSTITVTFKNTAENITLTDSVEITILEEKDSVVTLKEIRTGVANGDLGDEDPVKTYGKIVGHYSTSHTDHIKKGVFVQDGEYGATLVFGVLDKVWNQPDNFKIGDDVYIEGKLSTYMGLSQINPSTFRKLTDADNRTVTTPKAIELTPANYNADTLKSYMGGLFTINGLKYVEGDVTDLHDHNIIKFELPKTDGNIPVNLGLNYHIGEDQLAQIKNTISTIDKANSTIDLTGFICWSGAEPELSLAFIDGKTPAQSFVVNNPLSAPTSLVINGPTEVKATEKIQLSVAVTPDTASKGVIWSVDDETKATISADGELKGKAEGDVIVTAKSVLDETVLDTHNVKVLPAPAANGPVEAKTFENGGTYKLGFMHRNPSVDKMLFLKATTKDDKYIETTPNYDEGEDFVITKDGEGYTIMNGTNYLGVELKEFTGSKGKYTQNVPVFNTTKYVWDWNAEQSTFTFTDTYKDGDQVEHTKTYILGTKVTKNFDTVGISGFEGDGYKDYCLTRVIDYVTAGKRLDTVALGDHLFGLDQKTINKQVFITGEIVNEKFLATTTQFADAKKVTVAKTADNKYTLSFKVLEATKYIGIEEYTYQSGNQTKYSSKVILSDVEQKWDWNAEHKVFTMKFSQGDYYIGAYDTHATLGSSKLSYITNDGNFSAMLYDAPEKMPGLKSVIIKGKAEVDQGDYIYLNAAFCPSGFQGTVEWASKNPEVATVENGKVTGVTLGTAEITATVKDGEKTITDSFTVTVVKASPTPKISGSKVLNYFDFAGITETNKKVNPGAEFTAELSALLDTENSTAANALTKAVAGDSVYLGSTTGSYFDPAVGGMMKVGASKSDGKFDLTFAEGSEITHFAIKAENWKNKTATITVNGVTLDVPTTANHNGRWLVFDLETPTNIINIKTSKYCYLYGIAAYTAA